MPKIKMTKRWLDGNECICPPNKGRYLFSDQNTPGLQLQVKPSGSKSWLYRWYVGHTPKEMGLGPYPIIGLADARLKAQAAHLERLAGKNPIEEKRKRILAADNFEPTFETAAEKYIRTQEPVDGDYSTLDRLGWKSPKTAVNWRSRLATYAYPFIGGKSVSAIHEHDIRQILEQPTIKPPSGRNEERSGPLFKIKNETAKCLREYIQTILNDCRRWRQGMENPAKVEFHLYLSRNKPKINHQPALNYHDLPKFISQLTQRTEMSARHLEFKTITGLRPGKETLQMKWSEVDFEKKLWSVPAERMKMKEPHTVPLSKQATDLLSMMPRLDDNDFVFFSTRSKTGHISDNSVLQLLNRMGFRYTITPHGMRRTLREWCGANKYPLEVAESALAHKIGDQTTQAYVGDVYLEQRREMLQAFADYAYSLVD